MTYRPFRTKIYGGIFEITQEMVLKIVKFRDFKEAVQDCKRVAPPHNLNTHIASYIFISCSTHRLAAFPVIQSIDDPNLPDMRSEPNYIKSLQAVIT